jgi:hypothetical protein
MDEVVFQRSVERIAALGAVHRDGQDSSVAVNEEGFVRSRHSSRVAWK